MSVYIGNKAVHDPRSHNIGIDIFYRNTFVMLYTFGTFSTLVLWKKLILLHLFASYKRYRELFSLFPVHSVSEFIYVTLCFLFSWHILKVHFKAFEFLSQDSSPKVEFK